MIKRGIEIERRFKLKVSPNVISDDSVLISQWYLPNTGAWTIRCRITTQGGNGIKSTYCQTLKRGINEIESCMTQDEFSIMRQNCYPTGVTKRRYHKEKDGFLWELDVFTDPRLFGLEIAEIELPSFDTPIAIPAWIGTEITGIRCLSNMSLSKFLNEPDTRQAAIDAVTQALQIAPDSFTVHKLKTRISEVFGKYEKTDYSRMVIHKAIIMASGYGLLTPNEIRWSMSEDLTVLDLILLVAFIKRKKEKKK